MTKPARGHAIPLLETPGEQHDPPLYLRLYRRIRAGVLEGTIAPGTRLPSARTLARDEGISRNTVEAAIRQLQAEGFVVRRVGAGTWVSDRIPERPLRPKRFGTGSAPSRVGPTRPPVGFPHPPPSARGRALAAAGDVDAMRPGLIFTPCVPGLQALPLSTWNRLTSRLARRWPASLLLAAPPQGLLALRKAVAAYLSMGRGVRCTADQVLIVSSTQQAIDLVARILLDPGDPVWFEDPGYPSARGAFEGAGAQLVPVPVDDDGIDVAEGCRTAPRARLAYVTPSHQYPLGVTLMLERRLALLEWAERAGSWILEDDYDSELRYDGLPRASIQGIDGSGRVIYVGTFNKILFPALRIAYLVLPPDLVEPFARARAITDGFAPPLTQAVLAEFIDGGYFSIHLRRARALHLERRDRFLAAARHLLPDTVRLGPAEAGMHVVLHLSRGMDDAALSDEAYRRGLALPALSTYYLAKASPGLLVHYGNVPAPQIDRGVRELARILAHSQ